MCEGRELAKGFDCSGCGKHHRFSHYVYAHWRERLTHTCDCGQKHTICAGEAVEATSGLDSKSKPQTKNEQNPINQKPQSQAEGG